MSNKKWKKARSELKEYNREIDKEKRLQMRVPFKIRIASFFFPVFKTNWVSQWEIDHIKRLRSAFKTTAHLKRRNHVQGNY